MGAITVNNINWHAYLDGSMSLDERSMADQVLASDPIAKAHLSNLKAFVAQIQEVGLAEEIPLTKLRTQLSALKPRPRFQLSWKVAMPVAASLAFVAFFQLGRPAGDAPIVSGHINVTNFGQASIWMKEANGVEFPKVELAGAHIIASERTSDTGCFCMEIDGKSVCLRFSKKPDATKDFKKCFVDGCEFLEKPGFAAFKCEGGILWMVHAQDQKLAWAVARKASKAIRSI